jgi:hypothetical protein
MFLLNHLTHGQNGPTWDPSIQWPRTLHEFNLFRLDASFAMTPHASSYFHQNSNWILRPKPKNQRSASGFETQTTKLPREACLLHLLHDLDLCRCHPWSPSPLGPRLDLVTAILARSTWSTPPHVLLLVNVPKCQAPTVKLHVHPSPLRVHQHGTSLLTFSLFVHRLCDQHLHTNTTKRHVAHALTNWLVSKLNQSLNHLSTITHHKLDTQGHVSSLCS